MAIEERDRRGMGRSFLRALAARDGFTLPTRITLVRLFAVLPLWLLAFLGHPVAVGLGWLAAALTDGLDGIVARRTRTMTVLGSQLDSLADHLLSTSGFVWLGMLRPEFVRERLGLILTCAAAGLSALAVSWLRFRRLGDLHLYSAKAAAFLVTGFGISLLVLGRYHPLLLYVAAGTMLLAAAETILVAIVRPDPDEHTVSILLRSRRTV
ncbi:MAG TPA: CDP-alcohol phosphatidyltransferase family protein [Longimicrobiaceae bacterium]|nr:CDP-alcohol phosphatidyltransferase family protein [Longimicrobiaceae bacterium]